MESTADQSADTTIVGGGFFGCMIACHLAEQGQRVTLLEREATLLEKASYRNQARVRPFRV